MIGPPQRRAAKVDHRGFRQQHHASGATAQAQRPIDIIGSQEELLVQESDGLQGLTPHHEAGSRAGFDIYRPTVPRRQPGPVESPEANRPTRRYEAIELELLREKSERCEAPPLTQLDATVRVAQHGANGRDVRTAVEEANESPEQVVAEQRVVVEDREVAAARGPQRDVVVLGVPANSAHLV